MDRALIKQRTGLLVHLFFVYRARKCLPLIRHRFEKGILMFIVTNNPSVKDYFRDDEVHFVDKGYKDVLLKVRDYIHQNHILLTHPLSGSVKPNETPYKSIAVELSDKLDFESLELIENALMVYDKFQGNEQTPNWTQSIKEDFMVIDFDLIKNALRK